MVSASFFAISGEFNNVLATLPTAARKLRHIAADAARSSPGPVSNMKAAAAELDRAAAEATGKTARVEAPAPSATSQIQEWITEQSGQVVVMLVQMSMALLLTFFLLAAGDTFRRKMARLAGESLGRRRVTVEVLNEIDTQIQRYMATLLITNVLIAALTWAALSLLSLPNAGMWGVVTGVLHIIPYAGTVIAAGAVGVAALVEWAPWATPCSPWARWFHRGGDRIGLRDLAAGQVGADEPRRDLCRRDVLRLVVGRVGSSSRHADIGGAENDRRSRRGHEAVERDAREMTGRQSSAASYIDRNVG